MIDIVVKFYIVLFTLIHQKKKKKKEEKTWYLILKSDLKKLSKGSITVLCQIFLSN